AVEQDRRGPGGLDAGVVVMDVVGLAGGPARPADQAAALDADRVVVDVVAVDLVGRRLDAGEVPGDVVGVDRDVGRRNVYPEAGVDLGRTAGWNDLVVDTVVADLAGGVGADVDAVDGTGNRVLVHVNAAGRRYAIVGPGDGVSANRVGPCRANEVDAVIA